MHRLVNVMKTTRPDLRPERGHHPAGPRRRWLEALRGVFGDPVRLHRYRAWHARIIEDLMRDKECGDRR